MTIAPRTTTSTGLALLRSLIDANARSEYRRLHPELFLESEQDAFSFIRNYYQRHGEFPSADVCAENGHTLPVATSPVAYYMERCVNRATYNAIADRQEALNAAMSSRDMETARQILHETMRSIGSIGANEDVVSMADLLDEVMVDYEHAHAHPGMQGITLGWPELDAVTGGVEGGDVVTFAARPGMGKSWLLTHIAREAWRAGHSVLFVSMEMTGKQIARRFLAMDAGVAADPIRTGQLSQWTRDMVYQRVEGVRNSTPFHVLTGSFDKSVPLVDAAIQEFTPAIVFIDASYLMDPASKNSNKKGFELLSDVAKEIKQMAMERDKGVVQTVQFNREAEKAKKRTTAHIGGTDAVGQITTIGVSIKEGPSSQETTRRTLDLFKNREGEGNFTLETEFLFNPPSFRSLRSLDADEDTQEPVDPELVETAGGI